jgi:hypothetical protein
VLRAALERLQPEARARVQGEDEALLQAEAGLPEDLVWSDSDSSEEGDAYFFPDPEGGLLEPPVQSLVVSPPPTVSEAHMTQPTELTGLLQQLIQQQREDRLTAEEVRRATEEARRASEARFAQLQQEAARDRAAANERFAGLLDRVTQRQDAQIQQMQQGMFAMFGMVQQLLTHIELVPQQQTGLQGMSAPASAPGTVSSPAGISFSALFSPLPQVPLFQSPVRPTLLESTSVPPSAVSEQPQQCPSEQLSMQQAPPQQQTQLEQIASPSDDDDAPVTSLLCLAL